MVGSSIEKTNSCMKFLKSVWLVSVVLFTIYFLLEYLERGFDSVLFASGIALVVSGIGLLYKK